MPTPTLLEQLQSVPHLLSPAHLMVADTNGAFYAPPHLQVMNKELIEVGTRPNQRLIMNAPFRHGKSTICSHYFPAWLLLLYPQKRIILAAHETRFAATFGMAVKDVITRWGADLGVTLRKDKKSQDEWVIKEHGGGMVCRGMHGSIQGRGADLFLIEDPISNAEQAMSPTLSEKQWDWYRHVAYTRLEPGGSIGLVMSRWTTRDLCGRVIAHAKTTGEKWRHLKFKAIATEGDPAGRKPGQPLWPERYDVKALEGIRDQSPLFFNAGYQQEPEEEQGKFFHPRDWPKYTDLGDAYSLPEKDGKRTIYLHRECTTLLTGDWAWSEKRSADHTALGIFILTPCGRLLVRDVINERVALQALAPRIAEVCRKWRPSVAAIEVGHPTLENEVHRHPEIPPVQWLPTEGKTKLMRALPAIVLAGNSRMFLPDLAQPWHDTYCAQLAAFTGINDEADDLVDMTSNAGRVIDQLRAGIGRSRVEHDPCLLTPGREGW